MNSNIPFIDLKAQYAALKEPIQQRIQKVLDHGQYIMGPEVRELEEALEKYTAAKHCITVSSGTEALLIALMAIGLEPGDEVITTPFTFAATAEVIVLLGAKPVFVDVEIDTCNINAGLIEKAITTKTKAIMPVSLYGQAADMDEINALAEKYHLTVIEDGAQSFGAEYKGRKSGNLSTIGCTSFFPSKPLGCYGDGGAIFTNDDALAQAMREIRIHGQSKRYHHTRLGVGGRMDTLQCAIVLAKFERFEWEVVQRQKAGQGYLELLKPHAEHIQLPVVRADRSSVWGQFTVQVAQREEVIAQLNNAGIPTAVHYPIPLNEQKAYQQFGHVSNTPISTQVAKRVLSLPMSPDISIEIQQQVVERLVHCVTALA